MFQKDMPNIFFNFLLEEMGSNIDELQKDVSDLMTQAGIENTEDIKTSITKTYFEL
uniref:Uncharacterized protein n=1 Tax=Xenopus tropicalis TaxID=8364 RepID=A0A6I8QR23_XENTR